LSIPLLLYAETSSYRVLGNPEVTAVEAQK
jgi:hypothetical protein